MNFSKTLETQNLKMRTLNANDASEEYLSWMQDYEINKYLESRFYVPQDTGDLIDFINSVNASEDSLLFGIFLKENSQHIGNIKIGPIIARHARSEIGYLIGESSARGKGYAAEAIQEICRFSFDNLKLLKISAGVYEANISSIKTLLKAGFILEATISSNVILEERRIDSKLFGLKKT